MLPAPLCIQVASLGFTLDSILIKFTEAVRKSREYFKSITDSLSSLSIDLHHIKDSVQSIDENSKAANDEEHSPQVVIAEVHESKAAEDEHRADKNGTKRRDVIRLVIEGLTLLSVTFYGYMAVRQWREMISARRVSGDAIVSAKNSADAALNQAQRNFRQDQRPWIGMITSAIKDLDSDTSYVDVFYSNSGRSPAKVTKAAFTHHLYVTFPAKPTYERRPTDIPSVAVVVPGGALSNSDPFPKLTPQRIADMAAKHQHFFLYANVEYEDTRTHAKHWTHGCWEYLPNFHNAGLGLVNCSTYNEVDPDPEDK